MDRSLMSGGNLSGGETFLKASVAAARIGYSKDYITKLAREGRVNAMREGNGWQIDIVSLETFLQAAEVEKQRRNEELRAERIRELAEVRKSQQATAVGISLLPVHTKVSFQVVIAAVALFFFGYLSWTVAQSQSVSFTTHLANSFSSFSVLGEPVRPITYNEAPSNHPDFEGVIILNSSTTDETLNRVRNSFSDDVLITSDTNDSGYITPIFKERTGETYRYLMVPVTEGTTE